MIQWPPMETDTDNNQYTFTHEEILEIIGVLILSILLAALDQTIVSTALPTIAGELNGFDELSWLVTAYLLSQTIVMPIYGKLGDLFGRKRLIMSAVAIFLVGSALSGLSQTMWQLIIFRAVQGLGAGGLMVTAFAIVGDIIPPRDRGKYLGLMMPVFGLATVFGPTLGGWLIDHFSWRAIFYINIPIGLIALWVTWRKLHLREHTPEGVKIDYAGTGLLAIILTGLVFIATWGGGVYAWTSPVILSLMAGVAVLAALFVRVERRAHDPILPPSLFFNRTLVTCLLLGMTVGVGLFGSLTYLPTFLQVARGASPTSSGFMVLPLSLGLFVAAFTTGRLVSRTGRYRWFVIVGTVSASLGMYLLSTITPTTPQYVLDAFMLILGAGVGMVMPILTQVAQSAVSKDMIGVATSSINLARQLSGAIGVAVAGTIFASQLHKELAAHLSPAALQTLGQGGANIDPMRLAQLPSHVHAVVVSTVGDVLPHMFLNFVPVLLLGVLAALLLKEVPFKTR